MNFMKYDYYGNYGKNDDSYSFSIQEIHKKQKDKVCTNKTYRPKVKR